VDASRHGALLLLLILSAVFYVARQISRPLRGLSLVVDTVRRTGDHSLRAAGERRRDRPPGARLQRHAGPARPRAPRQQELVARHRAADAQRELVEAIPIPMMVTSIPGHEVLQRQRGGAVLAGWLPSDPWKAGMPRPTQARFFQGLTDMEAVDRVRSLLARRPVPSWALVSARCIVYQGQRAVLTTFTPINQMKLMEQRLELWSKVFEASSEGIMPSSIREGRIMDVNRAFCTQRQSRYADLLGANPRALLDERNPPGFYADITDARAESRQLAGRGLVRRKGRDSYPAWLVLNAVRDAQGEVSHYIAISLDISERKKNEQRIAYMALHDALTELPNRSLCHRTPAVVAGAGTPHRPEGGAAVRRPGPLQEHQRLARPPCRRRACCARSPAHDRVGARATPSAGWAAMSSW
jgi:PAS domain S-box-containing protein